MNYFNEDLSKIGFNLIEPSSELKPYIQSFWVVKFEKFPLDFPLRILADGNSGLVINFASNFSLEINSNKSICKDKITFFPPSKYSAFVKADSSIDVIGIRFNSASIYRFLEKDISSFSDISYLIKNDSKWRVDSLYQKLIQNLTIKEKINIIELFLLDIIKTSKKNNSYWIFDFINKIHEKKGNINIEDLCEEFNLNSRHVQRRFKIEVGLSVKAYARIIRIQDSKSTLSSLNIESLTSLSYEKGFFDQSHFINEFKYFMEETPSEYLKKKQKMAEKYFYKKYDK
jgi:AraC-like DNA-binding protein